MFDKDRNGQISQDELMSVMESLGMKPSEDEVKDIINEFDADSKFFYRKRRQKISRKKKTHNVVLILKTHAFNLKLTKRSYKNTRKIV